MSASVVQASQSSMMSSPAPKRDGGALQIAAQPPKKRQRLDRTSSSTSSTGVRGGIFQRLSAGFASMVVSPTKWAQKLQSETAEEDQEESTSSGSNGNEQTGYGSMRPASNGSSNNSNSGNGYARKEAMFSTPNGKAKHRARMDALRQTKVSNRHQWSISTAESQSTPSATGASSVRSPVSQYSDPSVEEMNDNVEDFYSTPKHGVISFVDYRGLWSGLLEASPSLRDARRGSDILKAHTRSIARNRDDSLVQLDIAKNALDSPRPQAPELLRFNKLQLADQEKSDRIEDLTRRRRKWPERLPVELQDIVTSSLKRGGVLATLPAAAIEGKDIAKLRPGQWLNDEIITFYGVMVNLRSAAASERRTKGLTPHPGDEDLLDVHCFNSYFYGKLETDGYSSVRRWSKKFDVFKKDIIIIPINLGNTHWVCAAINLRKKRFEWYDSMGGVDRRAFPLLRQYIEAEHKDKKKAPLDTIADGWTEYFDTKIPRQNNGYDCGVFVSQFMECLSRKDGHFDFHQKNMPYLRQKMIHEIVQMKLMPEQWL